MGLSNVQVLLTVNFLHFLNAGLVAPVMSYHITLTGGDHVVLGYMATMSFVCGKISKDVVMLFEHGTKHAINFSLYFSFVSFFGLVFYFTWWKICLFRVMYALTNQVVDYSKEYVAKTEPQDRSLKIFSLLDIMKISALVIGSVCGGYLFEYTGDFRTTAMVTTSITLLCIVMMQYVDDDPAIHRPQTRLLSLPSTCYTRLKQLTTVDYAPQWDSILLKITFHTAFVIFFTRFVYLIWFNYRIGSIVIGYSVAYQYMLKFASTYLVRFVKARITNKNSSFDHSLLICGASLMSLYYAPTYECFLIIFMPMIITYTLISSFLDDDILEFKSREGVNEAFETISILIHVIAPICFGIVCEYFGGNAFKVLSVFPVAVCVYFLNQRFLRSKRREGRGEVKED